MSKIIVTDPLLSELDGSSTPIELCDPTGRSLGHFLPTGAAAFRPRESDQCPYTPGTADTLAGLVANGCAFWAVLPYHVKTTAEHNMT